MIEPGYYNLLEKQGFSNYSKYYSSFKTDLELDLLKKLLDRIFSGKKSSDIKKIREIYLKRLSQNR